MSRSDAIKNRDLYYGHCDRSDHLYIVTKEPKEPKDKRDVVTIDVDLDDDAAVHARHRKEYPDQPHTDSDIQSRPKGLPGPWLLSGGAVIFDERRRLAIGLRDGNPTRDPFAFTNIGAGRCDRPLEEHCLEEIATEFIVCFCENGVWYQAWFGEETQALCDLDKPAIGAKIAPSLHRYFEMAASGKYGWTSSNLLPQREATCRRGLR